MWTARPQPSHPFKGFLSEDAKQRNCVTCLTLKTLKAIPCSAAHPSRSNKGVTPLPPPSQAFVVPFFSILALPEFAWPMFTKKKKLKLKINSVHFIYIIRITVPLNVSIIY